MEIEKLSFQLSRQGVLDVQNYKIDRNTVYGKTLQANNSRNRSIS